MKASKGVSQLFGGDLCRHVLL